MKFPLFNKGTAFNDEERELYGLHGLLPCHVSSLEEQLKRCYFNFSKKKTPLGKYIYLMSLLNRNEKLFYHFISRFPSEMLPYIYTPTVGEASIQFSSLTWQPRGLYVSYPLKDKVEEMLDNIPNQDIQVIVITDGERILGLGDQGIGGMTIAVGKLILYSLFAGIHPAKTLPVVIDVGTNNQKLLKNELYLGWRNPRIVGKEYDQFIDSFIQALKKRFPHVLLQWEDFGKPNARRLLETYRKKILSFNDDIQGTAGVVLAAIFSALKITNQKEEDQKFVILGGGSAGIGIAEMILKSLINTGLSKREALKKIFIIDIHGLIQYNIPLSHIDEMQKPYMKEAEDLRDWEVTYSDQITLYEVIKNAKPNVLIGVSAVSGAFDREAIQEMAKHVERPIIFPLSNPTSRAEAVPKDLIEWTKAKAIIATGTPFEPVLYKGKTYEIAQCNNVYLFPGLGLGALAAEAKEVTDTMIFEAAETLASHSPALQDPTLPLLPPINDVRSISREVAIQVAKKAIAEKVSKIKEKEIEKRVDDLRWNPST